MTRTDKDWMFLISRGTRCFKCLCIVLREYRCLSTNKVCQPKIWSASKTLLITFVSANIPLGVFTVWTKGEWIVKKSKSLGSTSRDLLKQNLSNYTSVFTPFFSDKEQLTVCVIILAISLEKCVWHGKTLKSETLIKSFSAGATQLDQPISLTNFHAIYPYKGNAVVKYRLW